MPTHWTYREVKAEDTLYQGDIVARDPLLDLLSKVQSHFCDPKYLAFIVLTQTCDMVVRKGKCKTKYICLAAIRSLGALMPDFLQELCDPVAPLAFKLESRTAAEQFLQRVLNQNEQAHGMFYLHPDADVGIGEPAVALLRVSISLRAKEHYDLIKSARRGRLDTEYRNKMGWLAGNLYSRVDTTDWAEHPQGEKELKKIIAELIAGGEGPRQTVWVPEAWVQAANKNKLKIADIPHDQVYSTLAQNAPKPGLEIVMTELARVSQKLIIEFSQKQIEAFNAKVASDRVLMPLLREFFLSVLRTTLEGSHEPAIVAMADDLCQDDHLRNTLVKKIQDVANARLKEKGPPELQSFLEILKSTEVFRGVSGRIDAFGEKRLGSEYKKRRHTVEAQIDAETLPAAAFAYLKMMANEAIFDLFPNLLASRLKNNPTIRSAVIA